MTPKTLRRKLARDFPIKRRVVVLFDECDDGAMGECWMENETIYIVIAPAIPDEQTHSLAHEWAHAILCDRHGKLMPRHSREWANEFARIYNRYWD